ncbi:hypothetical protein JKP88DRAFT_353358 [Tribonema minus]|uniref:Uncharacterized protein n=1 Tax=Tribonema minus TaxID=303371 RepID=A0A835Z7X5_9STRA|nr:hypothetical protein JKP88DRAFT_353358 [Tribonema minus]
MESVAPLDVPVPGSYLIAHPMVADECFKRSVVLVVEVDDYGTRGVVVNCPTPTQLRARVRAVPHAADWQDAESARALLMHHLGDNRVYLGGPVRQVLMLHRYADVGGRLICGEGGGGGGGGSDTSSSAPAEPAAASAQLPLPPLAFGTPPPGGVGRRRRDRGSDGGGGGGGERGAPADCIHVGGDLMKANALLAARKAAPSDFEIVVGVAAWEPGMLEAELGRGAWVVARGAPSLAVGARAELWGDMLAALGGAHAEMARVPPEADEAARRDERQAA